MTGMNWIILMLRTPTGFDKLSMTRKYGMDVWKMLRGCVPPPPSHASLNLIVPVRLGWNGNCMSQEDDYLE